MSDSIRGSRHMQFVATSLNMVLVSADATQAAHLQRVHESSYQVTHYSSAQQCLDASDRTESTVYILDLRQSDEAMFLLSQHLQRCNLRT